jgi:hypothetical protein
VKKKSAELNRYCPKCNTLLFENGSLCPVCRKEIRRRDAAVTRGMGLFFRGLLIIVVVVFAAAVIMLVAANKEVIIGFVNRAITFFS